MEENVIEQKDFIEFKREDGTIEYRHPDYDQMMAEADADPTGRREAA